MYTHSFMHSPSPLLECEFSGMKAVLRAQRTLHKTGPFQTLTNPTLEARLRARCGGWVGRYSVSEHYMELNELLLRKVKGLTVPSSLPCPCFWAEMLKHSADQTELLEGGPQILLKTGWVGLSAVSIYSVSLLHARHCAAGKTDK